MTPVTHNDSEPPPTPFGLNYGRLSHRVGDIILIASSWLMLALAASLVWLALWGEML